MLGPDPATMDEGSMNPKTLLYFPYFDQREVIHIPSHLSLTMLFLILWQLSCFSRVFPHLWVWHQISYHLNFSEILRSPAQAVSERSFAARQRFQSLRTERPSFVMPWPWILSDSMKWLADWFTWDLRGSSCILIGSPSSLIINY